jgi:hypothetical protein
VFICAPFHPPPNAAGFSRVSSPSLPSFAVTGVVFVVAVLAGCHGPRDHIPHKRLERRRAGAGDRLLDQAGLFGSFDVVAEIADSGLVVDRHEWAQEREKNIIRQRAIGRIGVADTGGAADGCGGYLARFESLQRGRSIGIRIDQGRELGVW